jgi:hypothetical protein
MFGSEVLDVAIGILFVYLTLSLICSAIQEGIAAFFKLRSKDLYLGIRNLLNDPKGTGLVQDFYNHPLIDTLFPGSYQPGDHDNLPSYIPPQAFALAIMDLAVPPPSPAAAPSGGDAAPSSRSLQDAIAGSTTLSPKTSQALLTLVNAAGNDAAKARDNIEQWYSHAMERVASLYKRKTQAIIFAIGAVLCAAVNADSIGLVNSLSTDKAVRDSLVAAANKSAAAPATASAQSDFESNLARIRTSGLPIGWMRQAAPGDLRAIPHSPGDWVQKIIGILLTIAAISLGAPFWFDVLSKVTVIRSAIKPSAPAQN